MSNFKGQGRTKPLSNIRDGAPSFILPY